MTGHVGTNTPKFVPPCWGRPPFDPTQTGLCKFGRGFGAQKSILEEVREKLSTLQKSLGVHKFLSAKLGFTPPPPKRAQNEEKLCKSVENPQNWHFFWGGGGGETQFYAQNDFMDIWVFLINARGTLISEPRYSTPCDMRSFPCDTGSMAIFLSQKSCRTKVPQMFSNFRPEFCPEFCSEFFPNFSRSFLLRFVGDGDRKKFTKNPRLFSTQNPQANSKRKSTKVFWGASKVTFSGISLKIAIFIVPRGNNRMSRKVLSTEKSSSNNISSAQLPPSRKVDRKCLERVGSNIGG